MTILYIFLFVFLFSTGLFFSIVLMMIYSEIHKLEKITNVIKQMDQSHKTTLSETLRNFHCYIDSLSRIDRLKYELNSCDDKNKRQKIQNDLLESISYSQQELENLREDIEQKHDDMKHNNDLIKKLKKLI